MPYQKCGALNLIKIKKFVILLKNIFCFIFNSFFKFCVAVPYKFQTKLLVS